MKKYLILLLILALGLLTVGCGKSGGRWVLVDTEFNEEEWYANLAEKNKRNGFYRADAEVSAGSFTWVYSYIGKKAANGKLPYAFPGNSTTTQGSWSSPSEVVHGPKFEVSMRLQIEAVDRHAEYPLEPGCFIDAEVPIPEADGGVLHASLHAADGQSRFYSDSENAFAPVDVIVTGEMEKGKTAGERRIVEVRVGLGYPPLMSYIYEWQK